MSMSRFATPILTWHEEHNVLVGRQQFIKSKIEEARRIESNTGGIISYVPTIDRLQRMYVQKVVIAGLTRNLDNVVMRF